MTEDPRPAPRGYDRCPECGVLTVQGEARTNPPERRKPAQRHTRVAVDLVSNLGAVMEDVADTAYQASVDLWRGDINAARAHDRLVEIADTLRQALSDDQAERAAFLEHFPYLCNRKATPHD